MDYFGMYLKYSKENAAWEAELPKVQFYLTCYWVVFAKQQIQKHLLVLFGCILKS